MKAMLREMKRGAKRCWLRCCSHALILMYHRVADLESDPQLLAVSPKHFAEHLQVIRKAYHPLHLSELVQALTLHQIPRRSIVLTFDDGYADNLYNAMPLLTQFHIPATVFVTAGLVGQPQELWWDELERLLLLPGTFFSNELSLDIQGQRYIKTLEPFRAYRRKDYEQYRTWNITTPDDPTVRHAIYRELHDRLSLLLPAARHEILSELRSQREDEQSRREHYRILTEEELRILGNENLIEIGAHTMTHPMLSMLSLAEQTNEIRRSRACLERIVEQAVVNFAYPYGGHNAYTSETASILRQSGFLSACSTLLGAVFPRADCFQLPRLVVRNCSGDVFARQLSEWF